MNKGTKKQVESLLESVRELRGKVDDVRSQIETIAQGEREKFDGMSERAQEGERGQKISDTAEALEQAHSALESTVTDLDDAESSLNDAVGIE